MKKILTDFFGRWWPPVILVSIAIAVYIISAFVGNVSFILLGFVLFVFGIGCVLAAAIYQLAKEKLMAGIISISVFLITVCLYILLTTRVLIDNM